MSVSTHMQIGWIGTGVMGAAMCRHLLERSFNLSVYNRTRSKAQPLISLGARWCDSAEAVAQQADVVFTMVGFPSDVQETYLGDRGVLAGSKPGTILVDMTTTTPSLAVQIAEAAQVKGVVALDAPVSGGDVGARNGTLSIMVGGDRQAFEKVHSLLEAMGKSIVYQGPAGSGQHTKMCNQVVIAGTMVGVCESLLYGFKAGLDLSTMLQSISGGAAGCWTLTHLAPRIIQRNFDPGFFVEHFIKDMGIALDEAKRLGLSLPGLALAHQLYLAVQAQGHGRCGTHALMLALERMSNTVVEPAAPAVSGDRGAACTTAGE